MPVHWFGISRFTLKESNRANRQSYLDEAECLSRKFWICLRFRVQDFGFSFPAMSAKRRRTFAPLRASFFGSGTVRSGWEDWRITTARQAWQEAQEGVSHQVAQDRRQSHPWQVSSYKRWQRRRQRSYSGKPMATRCHLFLYYEAKSS